MTEFGDNQAMLDDLSNVRSRVDFLYKYNKRQTEGKLLVLLTCALVRANNIKEPVTRRVYFEDLADRLITSGNPFVLEGIVEFASILESLDDGSANL